MCLCGCMRVCHIGYTYVAKYKSQLCQKYDNTYLKVITLQATNSYIPHAYIFICTIIYTYIQTPTQKRLTKELVHSNNYMHPLKKTNSPTTHANTHTQKYIYTYICTLYIQRIFQEFSNIPVSICIQMNICI